MPFSLLAQTENKKLAVYSITEYSDGYVIKAIDALKADTVSIISEKDTLRKMEGYRKIEVGKKYTFEIEYIAKQFAAMPPNNFVVRIKTTVVWRNGDRAKDIPVFGRNIKGLFIRM
jgi:hypothetical protein